MVMMPAFVDGPPAQPQRGGLLPACFEGDQLRGPDGHLGWLSGVQTWPENVAGWRVLHENLDTTPGVEAEVEYGNAGDDLYPVASRPVLLQTSVTGPKLGRTEQLLSTMRGRLERRLDAVVSQAIAKELWTGRLTQLDPYALPGGYGWANPSPSTGQYYNPYLNSGQATEPAGDALTPMRALGMIEAELGDRVAGGPLLIHVPLEVLTELAWSLERTGPLLTTAKGSIVVPDSGYPGYGAGEDEDTTDPAMWMFGSGPVMYWLGPIDVHDAPSEVIDRRDNSVEMFGERPFATLFDPQTLVGCAVTPSTP